jgi:hypothetical protein
LKKDKEAYGTAEQAEIPDRYRAKGDDLIEESGEDSNPYHALPIVYPICLLSILRVLRFARLVRN